MNEDKKGFVEGLGVLLRCCSREGVSDMRYIYEHGMEKVVITYDDGYQTNVAITGDSCIAIMHDVFKKLI